jgi:hypothetical protein
MLQIENVGKDPIFGLRVTVDGPDTLTTDVGSHLEQLTAISAKQMELLLSNWRFQQQKKQFNDFQFTGRVQHSGRRPVVSALREMDLAAFVVRVDATTEQYTHSVNREAKKRRGHGKQSTKHSMFRQSKQIFIFSPNQIKEVFSINPFDLKSRSNGLSTPSPDFVFSTRTRMGTLASTTTTSDFSGLSPPNRSTISRLSGSACVHTLPLKSKVWTRSTRNADRGFL